jgi:hypothetical protein
MHPDRPVPTRGRIPLSLKLAVTAWMVVWVPAYAVHYGAANFLWISDVALFLTFVAVWRESRLLGSSQLVGVLLASCSRAQRSADAPRGSTSASPARSSRKA